MFKSLPEGQETGWQGVRSGFIMRFKDPGMKNKRYRQQETWIRSLSRWINIWIVFSRCNWPGLKTHASPTGGQAQRGGGTRGAPKEAAVCSSARHGDRSLQRCRGWDQPGFRPGCSPWPARGAPGPPDRSPRGQRTGHLSPEAWRK